MYHHFRSIERGKTIALVPCHAYSTTNETKQGQKFLTEIKLSFQAVVKATQLQSFCHTEAVKLLGKCLRLLLKILHVLLTLRFPHKTILTFRAF
jgi:hypothetical protein